ncbi:MAG: ATP-binding protein [Candidatus Rokubacteria bacterium]|nr:ATP-binding protein [Candidatus Rokubacteria bacterium]
MGETRVDLLHLLEDLRDAYPGAAEETILAEIVANSLDSGATTIAIITDPAGSTLTIVDDGAGMRRRELARYHDLAATAKVRGKGIGFAGVGIKIGLLVSEEVLTEARRGKHHISTVWHLASRHRAPWKWVPSPGLVTGHGTAVQLRLRKSPLPPAGSRLHRGGAAAPLPAAPGSRPDGDPRHALPARRPLCRERPAPSTRDLGSCRARADHRAPGAQAQARGARLPGPRRPAVAGRAPRPGDQHLRQDHQARVGLARDHAVVPRPRRRADRSPGPGAGPHAQQGRLHPRRGAGRDLPRLPEGDPGGRCAAARHLGRSPRGGRVVPAARDPAPRAGSGGGPAGSRRSVPTAGHARRASRGRPAKPADRRRTGPAEPR